MECYFLNQYCLVNNAFQIVPELNQSKTLVIETGAIDQGVLEKNGITQLIFQIFLTKRSRMGFKFESQGFFGYIVECNYLFSGNKRGYVTEVG